MTHENEETDTMSNTTYHRPGQYVDEVLLATTTPTNSTTSVAAIVAAAPRGPVTPVRLSSWGDAQRNFGKFVNDPDADNLLQSLFNAFSAGARDIYAVRVAGTGAVAATLPFPIAVSSNPPGPSAVDIGAINPGVWGNRLYVEVVAGSDDTRFGLVVREVPAGAAITNSQIVERWGDLSLDPQDARYAPAIVGSELTGSAYITLALHSGYAYTDGDALAASTVAGGSKLAGGTDGAAVSSTALLNAVYTLDVVTQPLVLNLPGVTDAATINGLVNYADASRTRDDEAAPGRGDVFVVVDAQPGVDADAAISRASGYTDSDVLAVYYPQVVVPDPTNLIQGSTKLVPAGPLVVGRYMATDASRGVFKSPAGTTDGLLAQVVALDPAAVLKNPQLDRLNDACVNAIKLVPGRGFCVFGARTAKKDYITRYVSARRTLIDVRAQLLAATAYAPFENNDAFLWAGLSAAADKVLRELYTAGGLKGASPEQAYYVLCDSTNNTASTIELGEVHLEVGVALQRPAEFVVIQIGQFDGGAVVAESTV